MKVLFPGMESGSTECSYRYAAMPLLSLLTSVLFYAAHDSVSPASPSP